MYTETFCAPRLKHPYVKLCQNTPRLLGDSPVMESVCWPTGAMFVISLKDEIIAVNAKRSAIIFHRPIPEVHRR